MKTKNTLLGTLSQLNGPSASNGHMICNAPSYMAVSQTNLGTNQPVNLDFALNLMYIPVQSLSLCMLKFVPCDNWLRKGQFTNLLTFLVATWVGTILGIQMISLCQDLTLLHTEDTA